MPTVVVHSNVTTGPSHKLPIMPLSTPHFLLYSETSFVSGGRAWKFVLQSIDGNERFTAHDCETETSRERLELLAVLRGLEALDRPSRITLLTRSRYVRRGIRREINHWRERGWRWERFGELVPIRDHDLWKRIDRALAIHHVECWGWQIDEASASRAAQCVEASSADQEAQHKAWNLAATLGVLGRTVLTPISVLWRPPFTRAA